MNLSRLLTMTKKDIKLTTRETFFLFFIVMPIVMSIVLNTAVGSLGSDVPSLGVYGEHEVGILLESEPSLEVIPVPSIEDLREKVLSGDYDAGLILSSPKPVLLVSGKSLLTDRIIVAATLLKVYREQAGIPDMVSLKTRIVGGEEFSLQIRFMPFLLIMASVVGGLIISSSLIEEREKRTLNAVLVTPITPMEVIMAKSLFGLFLGLILGALILVLNSSFSGTAPLIVLFLVLGTLFTVGLGLIAGVIMDNITDLIARMKMFNLLLMFPALIILFPQIPEWLGKFFPTYYYIHPLLMITQKGAGWSDVWWEAAILLVVDVVVLIAAARILNQRMLGKEIKA